MEEGSRSNRECCERHVLADRVDEELHDYRERHGIAGPWETKERVVVSLTGSPGSAVLVRRAARMAMREDLSALTRIAGYWEGIEDLALK